MAVQLQLPQHAFVVGPNVIGPLNCPAGLHQLFVKLDVAALIGSIDVEIDIALDGVDFAFFCGEKGLVFPQPNDKHGNPVNSVAIGGDLGMLDGQPVLTTSQSKIRAIVTPSVAFTSAGGELDAS